MKTALLVDSISKEFFGKSALARVSFRVATHSIHGFLGPNGAGKSTTMNIISGVTKPSEGEVQIFGKNIEAPQRGTYIGFLPETPPLYPNMKVSEYLKFICEIFSLSKKIYPAFSDYVIDKCGIKGVLSCFIGHLSKGFRQKVAIAGAVIHNPEIIILDEPTSGLDPKAIVEFRHFIKDLAKNHTILLSSHQLHEVQALCDEVTIIHEGEIITSDKIESIKRQFIPERKITAKVKKWDKNCETILMKLGYIHSITAKKDHGLFHLELFCRDDQVTNAEILSQISRSHAEPFEFYEEKLKLEEIFQRATV